MFNKIITQRIKNTVYRTINNEFDLNFLPN